MAVRHFGFSNYGRRIRSRVTRNWMGRNARILTPARRLCVHCGEGLPEPGFTIITPPGSEDQQSGPLYDKLVQVQNELLERVTACKYVQTPRESFHMTEAELISGKNYVSRIKSRGRDGDLVGAVGALFDDPTLGELKGGPLDMEVVGLTFFQSCLIAAVGSRDEAGYIRLCRFRHAVYGCEELRRLGVRAPNYKYRFHITLAYVEGWLTTDDRQDLVDALVEVNKGHFDPPLELTVTRADLRRFEDISRFDREPDWPVFELG